MNFELSEKKPWEDKQSLVFKNWLISNASKSPGDWDSNFQEYIEIRLAHWRRQVELREAKREPSSEDIFKTYLERMDISQGFLMGKRVLDLGCADGAFVRICLDQDLTQEIYGIDVKLQGEATSEKYHRNFIEGDFRENIPIQNTDLIVAKASLHTLWNKGGDIEQAASVCLKALEALSPAGEMRIGPILKTLEGGYKDDQEEFHQMLDIISRKAKIKYEFIPVDIGVSYQKRIPVDRENPVNRRISLESVLIIRRDD